MCGACATYSVSSLSACEDRMCVHSRTYGLPCIGGASQRSCANASGIRVVFSRAHALGGSIELNNTRRPAGSPSHIGLWAPPPRSSVARDSNAGSNACCACLGCVGLCTASAQLYSTSAWTVCRHAPPSAAVPGDIPSFTPRHQKNTHKCSRKHLATFSFQRESDNGKVLFL